MKRKWKWSAVAAVALAAVFLFFHATLLQHLAGPLIADEPVDHLQYVGLVEWNNAPDGDRCIDQAIALVRQNPNRKVLLVELARTRLVEIGVLPSFESLCRNELKARDFPPQIISVIRCDGYDDWSTARAIRTWLADHPDAILGLLCGRFRSAKVRYTLDVVLDPEQAARVYVRGLPDHRYDETDWWKSRMGIKAFGFAWLRRLHSWFSDPEHLPPLYRNANDYEREASQTPGQAEYVMVLNGNENTRPFVAAALAKAGIARHALVTRVAPEMNNPYLPPYDEINRDVLLNRGVSPDRVTILPAAAATTYDEAQALAAFLKDRPQARVLIVTDDFHTRRSRWVFAKVLGESFERVSFVAAPADAYRPDRWWQDEAGFIAFTTEYLKLAFYAVYYGYFGYWLLACGVLVLVARWIRKNQNRSYRNAQFTAKDACQNKLNNLS